jgi:hypothetical protein
MSQLSCDSKARIQAFPVDVSAEAAIVAVRHGVTRNETANLVVKRLKAELTVLSATNAKDTRRGGEKLGSTLKMPTLMVMNPNANFQCEF